MGIRRRLRLSFVEFKLFKDPRELRDPYDHAVPCDWTEPDDILVKVVSKDVVEGALKTEKLPVLSFELFLRAL